MARRTSTSFRLTEGARELLADLAELRGISQAAVMEQAIRDYAASFGLKLPAPSKRGRGRPRKVKPRDDEPAD